MSDLIFRVDAALGTDVAVPLFAPDPPRSRPDRLLVRRVARLRCVAYLDP